MIIDFLWGLYGGIMVLGNDLVMEYPHWMELLWSVIFDQICKAATGGHYRLNLDINHADCHFSGHGRWFRISRRRNKTLCQSGHGRLWYWLYQRLISQRNVYSWLRTDMRNAILRVWLRNAQHLRSKAPIMHSRSIREVWLGALTLREQRRMIIKVCKFYASMDTELFFLHWERTRIITF